MSGRSNVLARLRRSRAGAARYVAAWFAVAYLSAGAAPCVAAASTAAADPAAAVHEQDNGSHNDHAHGGAPEHVHHSHEHGADTAGSHDGHETGTPSRHDSSGEGCPHCSLDGGAARGHDDHSSCSALEDLTNAAPQAQAAPAALAPALGPASFTLPPPLASPTAPPPWRSTRLSSVPLNVRNCVFLI